MAPPRVNPESVSLADAGQPTEKMLLRFWSKVRQEGAGDCWPWTASTGVDGYGQFMLAPGARRIASRLAYVFHYGEPIPAGLMVRHRCDNPPCCNPRHLELGTHAENMRDMAERNPSISRKRYERRGAAHPGARINLEIANAIRVDIGAGLIYREITRRHGVSSSHISRIKRGEMWPGY